MKEKFNKEYFKSKNNSKKIRKMNKKAISSSDHPFDTAFYGYYKQALLQSRKDGERWLNYALVLDLVYGLYVEAGMCLIIIIIIIIVIIIVIIIHHLCYDHIHLIINIHHYYQPLHHLHHMRSSS